MPFTVVIPARYASTRLPGKVLSDIAGKTIIQHVYERAIASGASAVLIATDDQRIETVARGFGAEVIMTDPSHQSGTDRIAEAIDKAKFGANTVVVNVQGDEPQMPPALIRQVAGLLEAVAGADMATLCEPLTKSADLFDTHLVKVVMTVDGRALYFSRAPIPWQRGGFDDDPVAEAASGYYGHIGIYAYRAGFVQTFTRLPLCEMERLEALEQLRVLHNGFCIHVGVAECAPGRGVDTLADLERARQAMTTS